MHSSTLQTIRRTVTGFVWILLVGSGVVALSSNHQTASALQRLWNYSVAPRSYSIVDNHDQLSLQAGDPVFVDMVGDQAPAFAGRVIQTSSGLAIEWSDSTDQTSIADEAVLYETPRSIVWVLKTMLPPEKQSRLQQSIAEHYQREAPRLREKLVPFVRSTLEASIPIVEKGATRFLNDNQPRIQQLIRRYDQSVVREKLVPLVKSEVMPIVTQHSQPILTEIGSELWSKASIWRFGWRYAYDISPLPQRDLVRAEFERFVKQEALPVIESHTDDIIEVQKRILSDIASRPSIRNAVGEVARKMIDDGELKKLVGDLLRASLMENAELTAMLNERWNSPEGQELFNMFNDSIQPLSEQIGAEIFGTPESGLAPEFVAVLRSQILAKDSRWLLVHSAENRTDINGAGKPKKIRIVQGKDVPAFPQPLAAPQR